MRYYRFFALSFAVLAFSSCRQDKITAWSNDCPDIVSFEETIEPMIVQSCGTTGCHAQGFVPPALTNYDQISSNYEDILSRITLDEGNPALMPLNGPKLADSLIQDYKCWIEQGTLDN